MSVLLPLLAVAAPAPSPRPWWIPPMPSEENMTCLSYDVDGCSQIQEMGACLSSRDGRQTDGRIGLAVHGDPCVWCGGGKCHDNGTNVCEPMGFLTKGQGVGFSSFDSKVSYSVGQCTEGIPLPKVDFTCLPEIEAGCSSLTDAASCLSHKDGQAITEQYGLKVQGQPCVWCGGVSCTDTNVSRCMAFDFVVNGAKRAFNVFQSKSTFTFASCKNGRPAASTLGGYAVQIPGYIAPVGKAAPLVPWWVPPRDSEDAIKCLTYVEQGCHTMKDQAQCVSSRDGRDKKDFKGLKIHGEPCVWCGGAPCQTNATNLCEPFDFLMNGEGVGFASFSGKSSFKVAGCDGGVVPGGIPKPHFDYSCLTPAAKGCPSLTTANGCMGSFDDRENTYQDALKVHGEPCVWCGGTVCHDGNSNTCEPFDYVLNGQGHAFREFYATAVFRIAACTEGKPYPHDYWGPTSYVPGSGWTTAPPPAAPNITAVLLPTPAAVALPLPAAVALPSSTSAPQTHEEGDCWYKCGQDASSMESCNACGEGKACCRNGFAQNPAVCLRASGYSTSRHECVDITLLATPVPPAVKDLGASPVSVATPVASIPVGNTTLSEETGGSGGWEMWRWLAVAGVVALCLLPFIAWALGWIGGKGVKKKKRTRQIEAIDGESESESDNSTAAERDLETSLLNAPAEPVARPDLFDLADRNHDGVVTEAEFASAFGAQQTAKPPPQVRSVVMATQQVTRPPDLFDIADRNHDGVVTGAEFAAAFGSNAVARPVTTVSPPVRPVTTAIAPARQMRASNVRGMDMFDMVDRNHDGMVTEAEFASVFGQNSAQRPQTFAVPRQSALPRGSDLPRGSLITEPTAVPPPPPIITEPIAMGGGGGYGYDPYR